MKSNGTLKAAQLFAPYGTVRYSQGTMPTTLNFTGQRLDSQTGLLYYNARYYDPVSGRFMRADTEENNTSGMDPYGYVGGNPETRNDPTGHWGWDNTFEAVGAIIAVAVIVTTVAVAAPAFVAIGTAILAGTEITGLGVIAAAGIDAAAGATVSEVGLSFNSAVTGQNVSERDIWNAAYIGGALSSGFGWIGDSLTEGLPETFWGERLATVLNNAANVIGGVLGDVVTKQHPQPSSAPSTSKQQSHSPSVVSQSSRSHLSHASSSQHVPKGGRQWNQASKAEIRVYNSYAFKDTVDANAEAGWNAPILTPWRTRIF